MALLNTPKSLFRRLTRWFGPAAPIVSGGITSCPEGGFPRPGKLMSTAGAEKAGDDAKKGAAREGSANGAVAAPVASVRLGTRRKGMARSPRSSPDRSGASARIASIDSRANGTLFVMRVPVDSAGPESAESPETATASRSAMKGAIRRRTGRG